MHAQDDGCTDATFTIFYNIINKEELLILFTDNREMIFSVGVMQSARALAST